MKKIIYVIDDSIIDLDKKLVTLNRILNKYLKDSANAAVTSVDDVTIVVCHILSRDWLKISDPTEIVQLFRIKLSEAKKQISEEDLTLFNITYFSHYIDESVIDSAKLFETVASIITKNRELLVESGIVSSGEEIQEVAISDVIMFETTKAKDEIALHNHQPILSNFIFQAFGEDSCIMVSTSTPGYLVKDWEQVMSKMLGYNINGVIYNKNEVFSLNSPSSFANKLSLCLNTQTKRTASETMLLRTKDNKKD